MKFYREENIKALAEAIVGDEYNELSQIDAIGDESPDVVNFILRNIESTNESPSILEVGCGSGRLLGLVPITHTLDASSSMIERLKKRISDKGLNVVTSQGFVECIPYEDKFDAILFMNGFFQVRSDYEAFIEINRSLKLGGRFIFNLYADDSFDIICGRVLGVNNYIRIMKEFGFSLVEKRKTGHICVEKVAEFNLKNLRKMQLIKDGEGYKILNFSQDRDGIYL
jgi:SAM-dependent methyltransferase